MASTESSPLLPCNTMGSIQENGKRSGRDFVQALCFTLMEYCSLFFCFLSGQHIIDGKSKIKSFAKIVTVVFCFFQLCIYAVHISTAVAVEYFRITNFTFTSNTTNDSGYNSCVLPQEHWKFSVAITIGSFAAFLSYSLITFLILMPVSCSCYWCSEHIKAFKKTLCLCLKMTTM